MALSGLKTQTVRPSKNDLYEGVVIVGLNGRRRLIVSIEDNQVIYNVVKSPAAPGKAYGVGFVGMCTKAAMCKWGRYVIKDQHENRNYRNNSRTRD